MGGDERIIFHLYELRGINILDLHLLLFEHCLNSPCCKRMIALSLEIFEGFLFAKLFKNYTHMFNWGEKEKLKGMRGKHMGATCCISNHV